MKLFFFKESFTCQKKAQANDKDSGWIEDVVRQYITKQIPVLVLPQSPRAPLRTINNYFTQ
jgi:hypothetical protein